MRCGGVSARREERRGRPGLGHAERREDAVLHEVVPAMSGDCGEDLAGHDVEHVVVRVGAAEARHGPGEPDPVRYLAAIIVRMEPQQVTRAQTQAASVCHEVSYRELASHVWVVQ